MPEDDSIRVIVLSATGRSRRQNEDIAYVGWTPDGQKNHEATWVRDDRQELNLKPVSDTETIVCAVADGMGGHEAGDKASQTALELLDREWESLTAPTDATELQERWEQWVQETNRALLEAGSGNSDEMMGMGTTLSGLLVREQTVFTFHVGDSRVYRFDGELNQLTEDHSLRKEMDDESIPSNFLANVLGASEEVYMDFERVGELNPRDRYLLCTDGLTDMLKEQTIESTLNDDKPLEKRAEQLLDRANQAGGRDNISFILMEL